MMETDNPHPRRSSPGRPLLLCTVLVVYGSLVPLEFVPLAWDESLRRFAQTPWLNLGADQRADWVANGLAYFPVGALAALSLLTQRAGWASRLMAALLASVAGSVLAVAVEFIQVFFPQRTMSLNDIAAEIIGATAGAAVAVTVLERWWPRAGWWHRLGLVPQQLGWAYALVLLALGLFPFDLLISAQEWQHKISGPSVAFWISQNTLDGGWKSTLGRLALEAIGSAPLALVLALRPDQSLGQVLKRAAVTGALFGTALELLQLAMVSTISQGASVFTRAFGVLMGAWVLKEIQSLSAADMKRGVRSLTAVALPLHTLVIAWLSGWFKAPWQSMDAAWQMLGAEVRFLPFYYHYYVTELEAVTSTVKVMALYAPVGLWTWALSGSGVPARTTASLSSLAAALMCVAGESGRLMAGLRPDPSNVIIAAASAAALAALLKAVAQSPTRNQADPALSARTESIVMRVPASVITAAPTEPKHSIGDIPLAALFGLMILAAVAWLTSMPWGWPRATPLILISTAIVVAWRPLWLPGVVLALTMLMDPRPWSGMALVNEYDLVLAALMTIAVWRTPRPARPIKDRSTALVLALVVLSSLASTAQTIITWAGTGLPMNTEPLGPLRGIDSFKGVLWGVLLVAWVRWRAGAQAMEPMIRALFVGLAIGTVGTVGVMGWEWLALGGRLSMNEALRLSGPLADMVNGGNANEAMLGLSLALSAARVIYPGHWALRSLAWATAMVAATGLIFTNSRAAHLALALILGLLIAIAVVPRVEAQDHANPGRLKLKRMTTWCMGVAATVITAWAGWFGVLSLAGPGAVQRMQGVRYELSTRFIEPWKAWALHDGSAWSSLVGMGWGAYPANRYGASTPQDRVMLSATVKPAQQGSADNRLQLLLAPGREGNFNQFLQVSSAAPQKLELEFEWLGAASGNPVYFELLVCRKWLLNSVDCVAHKIRATPSGQWTKERVALDIQRLLQMPGWAKLPLAISLIQLEGEVLRIARLTVRESASGTAIGGTTSAVRNPTAWLAMSDAHRAWKIESAYVTLLWERGALGVVTVLVLGAWLLRQAIDQPDEYPRTALALTLIGLAVMGLWDTWAGSGRVELLILMLGLWVGSTRLKWQK